MKHEEPACDATVATTPITLRCLLADRVTITQSLQAKLLTIDGPEPRVRALFDAIQVRQVR